ncbi:MAG: anaerobic carbon-monoxide dehydrogenase catalytic subunit [Candidatus Bipolaricaulota bacterium]|nr:MAG: anaerobic carbon-monoxide dehydrogenase catalytic subunit [Candidatus Bipolaricaulota bacterium]
MTTETTGTGTGLTRTADAEHVTSVFERYQVHKPCPFGATGTCCRFCYMGPCRVVEGREGRSVGICGATPASIAAKNFARMTAAGTSAHSDHGREVAQLFLATARGEAPGYEIRDERKLRALAATLEIDDPGDVNGLAIKVGERLLADFGRQEGEISLVRRAPAKRQERWRTWGVVPRGIDREVVETLHRTSIGVDQDPVSLIRQASRTALGDGWGGSMIATELQDILFGTPIPLRTQVDLGVLREDQVNVVIHGHEPALPEVMVHAAQDEDILALAKEKGATGINLAGICCTANEILMRHGVPIAGSFLQQELAIMTGAVDLMAVDVQCVMPSLPAVAKCFHTEIVTTSEKAQIPGATPMIHEHGNAPELAKAILLKAIESFGNRGAVDIPRGSIDLIAGFSHETINYMLGGRYRASYRPLNDAVIDGRIRGVVGVVGCNNPKINHGYVHTTLMRELIAHDILVLTTGCSAICAGKEELLTPEAAELAGSGLREICEAVGIPPVLHMGSCVDNSRLLIAATEMVNEGGLGEDISDVPAAGCAPEWMSEKAIAIGQYFVASGVYVGFGVGFPTTGSEELSDYLFEGIEGDSGGKWVVEPDPLEMARLLTEHIDARRAALKLAPVGAS